MAFINHHVGELRRVEEASRALHSLERREQEIHVVEGLLPAMEEPVLAVQAVDRLKGRFGLVQNVVVGAEKKDAPFTLPLAKPLCVESHRNGFAKATCHDNQSPFQALVTNALYRIETLDLVRVRLIHLSSSAIWQI